MLFFAYFWDFNFRTSMCCLAWSLGLFLPMHIDRIASYMVSITKLFWTCIHTHTVINNYFGLVFSMGYFLVLVFGFWCFSCWYFSIFLVGIFDIFLVGILVFVGSCRLQNGKQSVAFATNLCNALLPFVTCFGWRFVTTEKNKVLECKLSQELQQIFAMLSFHLLQVCLEGLLQRKIRYWDVSYHKNCNKSLQCVVLYCVN